MRRIAEAGGEGPNVRFWPKADIPGEHLSYDIRVLLGSA
jgi:hypothetical protein